MGQSALQIALCFHNHQPIGQFDYIIEHSLNTSYLPLIELLERYPRVRVCLYYSGSLLSWLIAHQSGFIERLRRLIARQQVEILTGGYYEPILVGLPDADKIGQIERLTALIRDTFRVEPRGMWLTERVWEPTLPTPIHAAGVSYTLLDDSHFAAVGYTRDQLFGYYVTEDQGNTVACVPTSSYLRFAIPWQRVELVMDWLREQAADGSARLLLMADDGEKFGAWPGSYNHCWGDDRYMESLFAALSDSQSQNGLTTTTPGQFISVNAPLGRAYLPSVAYQEMGVWSLRPDAAHTLDSLRNELEQFGRPDVISWMPGGTWRGFLAKYPEVNQLHKRMLMVSRKVHAMRKGRKREEACDVLWAGQSGDSYWHGLLGGLYLFNLRSRVYQDLLTAENMAGTSAERGDESDRFGVQVTRDDFDADGIPDVQIGSDLLFGIWNAHEGGMLVELDARSRDLANPVNLLNVVTRRPEHYHAQLTDAARNGTLITPLSADYSADLPDQVRAKESDLDTRLIYDWHRRAAFIDHFLDPSTELDEFYHATYAEQGDFVDRPYRVEFAQVVNNEAHLRLQRNGHVWIGDLHCPVTVQKNFRVKAGLPALVTDYYLRQDSTDTVTLRFGVEIALGMEGGNDPDNAWIRPQNELARLPLAMTREYEGITSWQVDSRVQQISFSTELDRPSFLWQFPLETITLSEGGFERGYQGTVLLHHWTLTLPPGVMWHVRFRQVVSAWPGR